MARQPRHQLSCQCCGLLFPAINISAKWCSNACRQWAYHERKRTTALVAPEGLDCRTWQGTAIERRQVDGFVNATAMCKANGKRWSKFRESAQCVAYMQALAAEDRISVFALVDSQRGGDGAGGSTWVHPDLATELARWISPAFSVFVNRWFRSELEAQSKPKPQLPPAAPPLPTGVHVVAGTRREAAQLWWEAISAEVQGALARRLSPAGRTDAGLPLEVSYSWQPRLF